jgi:hypothetical protein
MSSYFAFDVVSDLRSYGEQSLPLAFVIQAVIVGGLSIASVTLLVRSASLVKAARAA